MVRSKYEKCEMLLSRLHIEGTNKVSKTPDRVKKKHVRLYFGKTQMKNDNTLRSALIELRLSFFLHLK